MQRPIVICGGGNLAHAIAGHLSLKGLDVSVMTRRPHFWHSELKVIYPNGQEMHAAINSARTDPDDIITKDSDIIITTPGNAIMQTISQILPYLSKSNRVIGVFGANGFFQILNNIKLPCNYFAFSRVPFICRIEDYGCSVKITGFKKTLSIAGNVPADDIASDYSELFDTPIEALPNDLYVRLSNSNPLLHSSRIYSYIVNHGLNDEVNAGLMFYSDWNLTASMIYLAMDEELSRIKLHYGVNTPTVLEYYEVNSALELTNKIRRIESLSQILFPITSFGLVDYKSRYFTEDFNYGLKDIKQLASKARIDTPIIDEVLNWGLKLCENLQ